MQMNVMLISNKSICIALAINLYWIIASCQMTAKCVHERQYRALQVHCNDIPTHEDLKISQSKITHLLINCTINITNTKNQISSNKSIDLSIYRNLVYISIRNCPIHQFSPTGFNNLSNLQTIYLENLPTTQLTKNMFQNTPNIKTIYLIKLTKLNRIHPDFLSHQNRLQNIILIQTHFDPSNLIVFLKTIVSTLNSITWKESISTLYFPRNFFEYFTFKQLNLEANNITNLNFLTYVHTEALSLKSNPVSFQWSYYRKLSPQLISLNLVNTLIFDQFPNSNDSDMLFPVLKRLFLSQNRISSLSNNLDKIMPKLELLDVRYNKLTGIPWNIRYYFRMKSFKLLISNNMIHCNCELLWMVREYPGTARNVLCVTIAVDNGIAKSQGSLLKYNMELMCNPPVIRLTVHDEFNKEIKLPYTLYRYEVKKYKVFLYKNEMIRIACIGEADPAPSVNWSLRQSVNETSILKSSAPSLVKQNNSTVISNIKLFHSQLINNISNETNIINYKCEAFSRYGQAEAELSVILSPNSRHDPVIGKIVGGKRGWIVKSNWTLIFSVTVLFLFDAFYLIN